MLAFLHVAVTGASGAKADPAVGDGEQRVSRHLSFDPILLPPTFDATRAPDPVEPLRGLRALHRVNALSSQQATLVAIAEDADPQVHVLARRQVLLPLRLCATGEDDSPSGITIPSLG